MTRRRTINSVALTLSERIPFLGALTSNTRKGIMLGALLGIVLFFAVGALLGELNRGWSGAVVGGVSALPAGLITGAVVGGLWGRKSLPQEGEARVEVFLDQASAMFEPGDSVSGSVEISAENTLILGRGQVFLVCRGLFVHDKWSEEDGEAAPERTVDTQNYVLRQVEFMRGSRMRRGASLRFRFNFPLPEDALPSHDGHVCSIEWAVHVALDVPDVGPLRTEKQLHVQGTQIVVPVESEGYQSVASSSSCQLALRLTRVAFTEGETVNGRVIVSTKDAVHFDDVRVILVRIENTIKGDNQLVYVLGWDSDSDAYKGRRRKGANGTTYVWLEDDHVLDTDIDLEPPQSATYSFSLPIPDMRRPTFATAEGSVMWKVGVIGERGDLDDLRAFHEILISTRAPFLGVTAPTESS